MAISIIADVFAIQGIPSAAKFVLVALADCSDEMGRCYPSVKHICLKTNLDRKTVLKHITAAIEGGYLRDTGERVGSTRQVRILQITVSSRHSETVPKTVPVPYFRGNGPIFGTRNRKETNHRFTGGWEAKTNGAKIGTGSSDLYPGGRT